jgi:hypothetical protein
VRNIKWLLEAAYGLRNFQWRGLYESVILYGSSKLDTLTWFGGTNY